ncbi:MAG: sulfotransferase domain-containing protein [Flavobacteriales bacterium]
MATWIKMTPERDRWLAKRLGPGAPNVSGLVGIRAVMYVFWIHWKNRLLRTEARRVNFCIIGAQKSGTSALASHLKMQPEVLFSSRKEVFYFSNFRHFWAPRRLKSKTNHDWYHQHFDWSRKSALVGEATPMYLNHQKVPQRMRQYNPEMKIIAVLRNPVDRLVSAWNMYRSKNQTHLDFREWCAANPRTMTAGLYALNIERWQSEFAEPSSILWIRYDDLKTQPRAVLQSIHSHLGLPAPSAMEPPKKNVHPYITKVTLQDRLDMHAFYEEDIRKVEEILGWDLSAWNQVG